MQIPNIRKETTKVVLRVVSVYWSAVGSQNGVVIATGVDEVQRTVLNRNSIPLKENFPSIV